MISVIIADDHQMFIDGMKLLLEKEPSISVVGEALNGKLLLELLEERKADIVMVDINMPVIDGIEVTKIICRKYPDIKVLILTMYNTKQYIAGMIAAGASGYILKNTGQEELIDAIKAIYNGDQYFSDEVTSKVMESFRRKETKMDTHPELTAREKEVLKLLADDLTGIEIGKRLNISHHTVDAHRRNMLSKFNVRTTVGLVRLAMERGLID